MRSWVMWQWLAEEPVFEAVPKVTAERSQQPQKQKPGSGDWSCGIQGSLPWMIWDERLIWMDLLSPEFLPRIGVDERHGGAWGTLSDSCIKNYHVWKGPVLSLCHIEIEAPLLQWPTKMLQSIATDQGASSDSQTAKVLPATLTPTR